MAKVLGMGNALVDIMIRVPDEKIISDFGLLKGGMKLVGPDFIQRLMNAVEHLPAEKAPGGSAANTINGVSNLGLDTGFIGKVGKDLYGKFMEDDMFNNNIHPVLLKGHAPTGLAVALVTPDSERTFAVNLGCAIELTPDDIHPEMFYGYDYFHIEGYLVQNHALLRTAIEMAHQQGARVSLDLASFDVVEDHLDFLKEMIENSVDIVFANEDEARTFTGLEPEGALHELYKKVETVVVKTGKKGSLIKHQDEHHHVDIIDVKPIDTTGAGDLYAGGFLYGLANNLSPQQCGKIGTLLAGKVIEVLGAKMNPETWEAINCEVKQIIAG